VSKVKVFTGNATPKLAQNVADKLNIPLGKVVVDRFSDGEIRVEILENVRGGEVFIIQSTCRPTNENLMELVIMADAFRRASATHITAVIPYFGYARQDRRVRSSRVPITAKVVADMLTSAGVTRVVTVDLHADQIQGFFRIPVDNIYASNEILDQDRFTKDHSDMVIVSPDVGGVVRARAIAKRFNDTDLAIIDKRRSGPNHTEVMNVIGDVKGKDCLIVDDIVDTAGTLCQGAVALTKMGARSVSAYCTHAVLSGPAIENICASPLKKLIVSDTVPLSDVAIECGKVRQVSLSDLIAKTILRIEKNQSVSEMFD
jgi:ribose-phosphate pyrophosphokinase